MTLLIPFISCILMYGSLKDSSEFMSCNLIYLFIAVRSTAEVLQFDLFFVCSPLYCRSISGRHWNG